MFLERHFQLEPEFTNLTVRQLLNDWYIPRKWQHELRIGRSILINGHYQSFNEIVPAKARIDLQLCTDIKEQQYLPATASKCQIVYEDEDLLIANKPAALKTHPNSPVENGTLFNQLAAYLPATPLMLHRLDMMTSGLIMVGKNPLVVPIIERQLALKELQRTYVAVVPYNPNLPETMQIKAKIDFDPEDPRKRRISDAGKTALTNYKLLQHNQNYALVELNLLTGRTHQIRVHLQSLNTPILGDPLYSQETAARLFLHAYQLKYQIPFSKKTRTITLPVPDSFLNLTKPNI